MKDLQYLNMVAYPVEKHCENRSEIEQGTANRENMKVNLSSPSIPSNPFKTMPYEPPISLWFYGTELVLWRPAPVERTPERS